MALKISHTGIRGTLGDDERAFSPVEILRFFLAFGQYVRNQHGKGVKIAIGKDGRRASTALSFLAQAGLSSVGCDVINSDLIMTPTLQTNIREDESIQAGIMITASHNPLSYAGFKLLNDRGELISRSQIDRIIELKDDEDFGYLSFEKFPRIEPESYREIFIKNHMEKVLSHLPVKEIQKMKFKVAIDCCSSSGICLIDFLRKLGCAVFPINDRPTQDLNRDPEPSPDALGELSQKVISSQADVGFALDPDGDRLVLVDNEGKILREDYTFLLILYGLLGSDNPRRNVVASCSVSSIMNDIIAKSDKEIEVHETAVGEKALTEKINQLGKENVLIAGEDTGSSIVPWINPARDSMTNAGLILKMLAKYKGKRLKEVIDDLPPMNRKKLKIPIDSKTSAIIQEHLESYKSISEVHYTLQEKEDEKIIFCYNSSGNPDIRIIIGIRSITIEFIGKDDRLQFDLSDYFSKEEMMLMKGNIGGGEVKLSFMDGIKLFWGGGFLLLRSSNTEPIVRIILDYR